MLCLTTITYASNIEGQGDYEGKVNSIAVGFYSHVGVELEDGKTCHGRQSVVLLTSNPLFKEIYSALLSAKVSDTNIEIHRLGLETSEFGGGYCVILWLAVGDYVNW